MKEIIKLGLILLLTCVIASTCLGVSNDLTKDQITLQREQASEKARKEILPDAKEFKALEEAKFSEVVKANDKIAEVYVGYNGSEIVGYTFKALASGYGGNVEVITGIDKDGVVSGVRVGSHQETPGLGGNATLPSFYEQYTDKTADSHIGVSKVETSDPHEIQAISGATITSKAVTNGVNMAIDVYDMISGN